MSTITLPNIRVSSDLTVKVRLNDGGVAIDWSTLTKIKASIYSDAQRALAGRCDVSIDAEDSTLLVCNYAANKPQYVGVNRIVVSAKYMGETKTYDKPAFTFVRWTADQEGEQITIDDPDVDVEISVEDISSSILQEAVDAAFEAADRANDAAAAAEHMVDIHTGPEGKSAYEVAVEEGYTGTEDEWLASLVGPQGAQGIQGETGEAAGFGTVSVSLQEDGGQPSATVAASGTDTAKNFAFTFNNLKGEKGDKGDQGNSGYTGAAGELEVVNNLTDGGATKALSAEMGKTLEGEVSQLEAEVDELDDTVDAIMDVTHTPSVNLFDKSAATPNKYINRNDGSLASSSTGWEASDFIDISGVTEGSVYITGSAFTGNVGWACYDANKVYKHGGSTWLVEFQEGDAYVRFSVKNTDIDTAMLTRGTSADVPGQYVPYGPTDSYKLKAEIVEEENIVDGAVTTDKIANGSVTAEKLAPGSVSIPDGSINSVKLADDSVTKDKAEFIIKTQHGGTNLINPATCVDGFIRSTDGVLRETTTDRKATDFIPVTPDGIYQSGYNQYGTNGGWAVYDENKAYIRGGLVNPNTEYVYQAGDAYIRLTMTPGTIGVSAYVVKATDPHIYTPYAPPYTTYQLSEDIDISAGTHIPAYDPALSLAGTEGEKGEEDSISNDTAYLSDYPQYLKRQFNLALCGKITAFAGIDIGVGKDTYNGTFLRVDGTNIYLCRYNNGNESIVYTQAHGLTISDFVNVSAYMDDGVLTAIVGTADGVFKHSFNRLGNVDSYGIPFVTAPSGTSLTGFSFRSAGTEFRKPIWVIGDSYMSWYPQRWPFQLWDTIGIKSFLLDGLAGGGSQTMLAELQKMLNYGTPKFLLWCLGMNDTADAWSAVFSELSELCESKGITLIPQTIPWPENNSSGAAQKALINSAIIASGDRYLDGYSAVSSDNNGTWYDGFTEDGVHPSVIGAKAMATRFLADFPEFLQ